MINRLGWLIAYCNLILVAIDVGISAAIGAALRMSPDG